MEVLLDWFVARTRREQILLRMATVTALAAVAYTLLFEPLWGRYQTNAERLHTAKAMAERFRSDEAKAAAEKIRSPIGADSLKVLANGSDGASLVSAIAKAAEASHVTIRRVSGDGMAADGHGETRRLRRRAFTVMIDGDYRKLRDFLKALEAREPGLYVQALVWVAPEGRRSSERSAREREGLLNKERWTEAAALLQQLKEKTDDRWTAGHVGPENAGTDSSETDSAGKEALLTDGAGQRGGRGGGVREGEGPEERLSAAPSMLAGLRLVFFSLDHAGERAEGEDKMRDSLVEPKKSAEKSGR
ncbi:hypothetical protein GTO89_09575 [Heliobacterium gestii]|uniref:Type II secretion system protein M n=1 Tax=Heliomicrobium gestii TaxID=2699 RepID=A0A845L964_HELGE|nr:type II secretion system protein GspM [Heliomicrobium gestii]MBM7867901.1 hypothetical protein [Heliomicrobium gestii]MZP43287.1 hypothetical protein [Heliomicrobium gestii]